MIKILLIVLLIILYLSKRESFSNEIEPNNIITFNSINYKDRIEKTKELILDLKLKKGSKILDIGGKQFNDFCDKNNYKYFCIDLHESQKTGTGGYNKAEYCASYDGRNLPYQKNEFDLVIVNFVLHHAAHNTLYLLNQIANITSKYVIIGEDLSELNYDIRWHTRNFEHQPGGMFRSDEEWKTLFKFYNLKLIKQYNIKRKDDFTKDIHRCMYILEKK